VDATYHAKRRTQFIVVAFGLALLVVGAGIAPRLGGWVAVGIGALALVGGLSAFVPGAAFVRFSPDGLTVKYAFLPARTVAWPEIAAATSELVPLIRHRLPSLVITYVPGYAGKLLGQRLDEHRSYVGNFTTASGDELAARAGVFLNRP